MWEVVRLHSPDILLLTETHVGPQQPLPSREGYNAFQAAGPRTGRGGVAAYLRQGLTASVWRNRPKDGVLWLHLPSMLPGDRDLMLAVCYWPPRQGQRRRMGCMRPTVSASISGQPRHRRRRKQLGRPSSAADLAEADERWLASLAADWLAAVQRGAMPVVAGDLNARTGTHADWPSCAPSALRRSEDPKVSARGQLLLRWCQECGARICNGRAPGDERGAATSWGVQSRGRAVVDYFLVPAVGLPAVTSLQVTDEAAVADHACLVMHLAAVSRQRQHQPQPPEAAEMRALRFRPPVDQDQLDAAVALLAGSAALEHLATAADAAATPEAVEAVALLRDQLVAAACRGAGLQHASDRSKGRQPSRRSGRRIPPAVAQRHGLPQLQAAYAAALRRQPGSQEHRVARKARAKARQAAQREACREQAVRLERMYLEQHDTAGFHKVWRGPRASLPDWALQDPDSVFDHFQALLAPPPQCPPNPDCSALALAPPPDTCTIGAPGAPTHPTVMWATHAPPAEGCDAGLLAALHTPFTPEEAATLLGRAPLRKATTGLLSAWLARPAAGALCRPVAAELNSWRRVGRLPHFDARSSITPIPKTSAPASPADLRGIAVGSLLAKLYAAGLERRVSDYAEAVDAHAEGQFGFRRRRSTEHAVFVLRTLIERHRRQRQRGSGGSANGRQRLWACFIDFKAAYDTVPREQLWAKLRLMGLDGPWLQAAQALYTEVPMSVNVPGLQHRLFEATQGLKQGCPLSPTLFSLYIADFEQLLLEAAQRGEQLDLPCFAAGSPVPALWYADDCALLSTTPAGLQAQLRLLESYCQRWGLTVNLTKTKAMLLAGAASEQEALRIVRQARLTYGGGSVPAVTEFKYLGVQFHCCRPLGESAVAGRCVSARFAAALYEGRLAELGLEAARLLLQLYSVFVDTTLSYAAAVWAPGLAAAAAARPVVGGGGPAQCEAELLQLRHLRRLLGLPQRTPTAVLLAEAGQPPLYTRWLEAGARLWNDLLSWPEDSLLGQALRCSLQLAADSDGQPLAALPWAAQLARGLQQVGLTFDPQCLEQLQLDTVRQATLGRHLERVDAAADSHSRLRHYFRAVRPGCLSPDGYSLPEYVRDVRGWRSRRALAELRTGIHWGAEETGRLAGLDRQQRICPHCAALGGPGGIEDAEHILLHCPLYSAERDRWPELGFSTAPTLRAFLEQSPPQPLARFAEACRRRGRAAAGLPP